MLFVKYFHFKNIQSLELNVLTWRSVGAGQLLEPLKEPQHSWVDLVFFNTQKMQLWLVMKLYIKKNLWSVSAHVQRFYLFWKFTWRWTDVFQKEVCFIDELCGVFFFNCSTSIQASYQQLCFAKFNQSWFLNLIKHENETLFPLKCKNEWQPPSLLFVTLSAWKHYSFCAWA